MYSIVDVQAVYQRMGLAAETRLFIVYCKMSRYFDLLYGVPKEGGKRMLGEWYERMMEGLAPFFTAHWQWVVIGTGALFFLGAVFRWKWVCNPQGDISTGFKAVVYQTFGDKGYRVLIGLGGVVIMVCGGVLWVLM